MLIHISTQNPTHVDNETYCSRNPRRLRTRTLLDFVRLQFVILTPKPRTHPASASDFQQATELADVDDSIARDQTLPVSEAPRKRGKSYYFIRTPRKSGDRLIPDDVNPPEAWGWYFEEGFGVHNLAVLLLLFYGLGSFAFVGVSSSNPI